MFKKILGYVMLSIPVLSLFIMIAIIKSFIDALILFLIVVVCLGLVIGGIKLIS